MLDLPPVSPRPRRRAEAETAHFLQGLERMRLKEVRPWLIPWSSAVLAHIELRLKPAGALRTLRIGLAPPGPATSPDLHRVDLGSDARGTEVTLESRVYLLACRKALALRHPSGRPLALARDGDLQAWCAAEPVLAAEALRAAALVDPDPVLRRFFTRVHVEQEREHCRQESQHARVERLGRHREVAVGVG